jgi:NAD(P)-dependent dehydrogenase (short-subunit alcohol dehydrogenase family)
MSHTNLLIGGNSGAGIAPARLLAARGDTLPASAHRRRPLAELWIAVQAFAAAKFMAGQMLRPGGGLSSLRVF